MASSRESSLDAISECPVCLERYEEPKQLPCDHTVCLTCLSSMAGSQRTLLCPICRTRVLLPRGGVDQLPSNLTMVSLIDALTSSNSESIHCEFCWRKNVKKAADHFCKQCRKYLCIECAFEHKGFSVFTDHELVAVDDEASVCLKHKEVNSYSCLTCKRLLCAFCIQTNRCGGHQVAKLVSEQDKIEDAMKEIQAAVSKYRDMHLSPTETIDKEIQVVNEQKDNIRIHVGALIEKIKVKENELMETLQKRSHELMKIRRELMSNFQEKASLLTNLKDSITALSALKLPYSILPSLRVQMSAILAFDVPADAIRQSLIFKPEKSIHVGKLKWCLNEIGLKRLNLESTLKKQEQKAQEANTEGDSQQEKEESKKGGGTVNSSTEDGDDSESDSDNGNETEPVFWESSV